MPSVLSVESSRIVCCAGAWAAHKGRVAGMSRRVGEYSVVRWRGEGRREQYHGGHDETERGTKTGRYHDVLRFRVTSALRDTG